MTEDSFDDEFENTHIVEHEGKTYDTSVPEEAIALLAIALQCSNEEVVSEVDGLLQSIGYLNTELAAHKGDEAARAQFTCNDCPRNKDCLSRWDSYNTDGDCLEDK
jgi:hypothetical protein